MRKVSKTGIVLVGSMILCIIMALAIGVPSGFFSGDGGGDNDLNDDNTPGISDVIDGKTPLLMYDKRQEAKLLMEAMEDDRVVSVNLLYDQGGGNGEAESSDPDVIRQAYKAMKNITVLEDEEVNVAVTDSYHHVYFTLEDGTKVGYSFEGEDVILIPSGAEAGSSGSAAEP
ncbi:MAG: hypothetical protein PUE50_00175, partial [Firmicutes bacterium]|nr:hypothetical protein [Bacillota bacterium]